VWDCTQDQCSRVQALLPPERRARSSSAGPVSVILILRSRDRKVTTYDSGVAGHQRQLTIGVIDWPVRKVQGVYLVEGESPGSLVFRGEGEAGPVVGDTTQPLLQWITRWAQRP